MLTARRDSQGQILKKAIEHLKSEAMFDTLPWNDDEVEFDDG